MTGESLRVLVVDDDVAARALHGRFVSAVPGFTVVGTVGTGVAAVRRVRSGGVDLVLLDMRLPDVSGIEVLRRIRAVGGASPDVFIISSARDQLTVRQALAAHIEGYLIKPFTRQALCDRLSLYRERQRSSSELVSDQPFAQGEIDRLFAANAAAVMRAGAAASGAHAKISQRAAPATAAAPEMTMATSGDEAATPAHEPSAGEHVLAPDDTSALPKGVSALTLKKVVAALDPVAAMTANAVAEKCGISRATSRRYLDYLVSVGVIDLAHRYGRRGRPEVLYRLAISQLSADGS